MKAFYRRLLRAVLRLELALGVETSLLQMRSVPSAGRIRDAGRILVALFWLGWLMLSSAMLRLAPIFRGGGRRSWKAAGSKRLGLLFVVFLLVPSVASAQYDGWFDAYLQDILNATVGWTPMAITAGTILFVSLATIEMAISGTLYGLRGGGVAELITKLTIKVIVLVILFAMMISGAFLAGLVVDSFNSMGLNLVGVPGTYGRLGPSQVVLIGGAYAGLLIDYGALIFDSGYILPNPIGLLYMLSGLFIYLVFGFIAFLQTLLVAKFALTVPLAPFFLGMAGWKQTAGIADGFISYVVQLAVQYFLLLLVIGVGISFFEDRAAVFKPELAHYYGFEVALLGFILAAIAFTYPREMAQTIAGKFSFGISDLLRLDNA